MATDGLFIIDAVAHPYNHDPSNHAEVKTCQALNEMSYQLAGVGNSNPEGYAKLPDVILTHGKLGFRMSLMG